LAGVVSELPRSSARPRLFPGEDREIDRPGEAAARERMWYIGRVWSKCREKEDLELIEMYKNNNLKKGFLVLIRVSANSPQKRN